MVGFFKFIRSKYYKWTERPLNIKIEPLLPVIRPGTHYGGWLIPEHFITPQSVVYLAGAGEDVSFDAAVADQFGCDVHIIDPTPRAATHVAQLKTNIAAGEKTPLANIATGVYPDYRPATAEKLHFHTVGLWNEDTVLKFYAPANPAYVSHSIVNLQKTEHFIEVPVCRLTTLMQQLGHSEIDLLKIDIEGAEYTVLSAVLAEKIKVKVICVEYDENATNHIDGNYTDRIEGSLQALCNAGYHIIAKESHCHNYTLVHQSILPGK
jgi:FkbM family methyltransferase